MPEVYIGLDIGASSVKIVQLGKTAGKIELISYGIEEIPRGKETLQKNALIIGAIRKIVEEKNIKGGKVISNLSGKSVVIRNIQLPLMPEEEMGNSVSYEAEQYMPFPPEETALDFLTLEKIVDKGVDKLEVAVVGAQKRLLEEHISLVKEAGLKLTAIDVTPFALRNSLLLGEKERVVALIDIGAEATNINIFKERILHFVRDIFTGGDNLTRAVSESFKIDLGRAEELKRKYGIILEEEGEPDALQASEIVRVELEQLLIEIRRSFDYYLAQSREARIDKIILSGGCAKLKNIDKFFSESLGIETGIANPLKKVPGLDPLLAVGAGLALSGYEEKRINLLPPKLRPRELRLDLLLKNKAFVGGATLVLILLIMHLSLSWGKKNYTRKINLIKKDIVGLESVMTRVAKIRREEKILRDKSELLTRLVESRFLWSNILKKMGEIVPEGVWLKELSLDKGGRRAGAAATEAEETKVIGIEEVSIKGSAFNNQLIAQYMLALESLPYFENIDLVFTEKKELAVDFEVKANWR
jgi:type IV pilus assembly protein PilM